MSSTKQGRARAAANGLHVAVVAAVYWLSIDGTDRRTDGHLALQASLPAPLARWARLVSAPPVV